MRHIENKKLLNKNDRQYKFLSLNHCLRRRSRGIDLAASTIRFRAYVPGSRQTPIRSGDHAVRPTLPTDPMQRGSGSLNLIRAYGLTRSRPRLTAYSKTKLTEDTLFTHMSQRLADSRGIWSPQYAVYTTIIPNYSHAILYDISLRTWRQFVVRSLLLATCPHFCGIMKEHTKSSTKHILFSL